MRVNHLVKWWFLIVSNWKRDQSALTFIAVLTIWFISHEPYPSVVCCCYLTTSSSSSSSFFVFSSFSECSSAQHDTCTRLSCLNVHSFFWIHFRKFNFRAFKERKLEWLLNSKTNWTAIFTVLCTTIAIGTKQFGVVCQWQRSMHIRINSWQTIEVLARFPLSLSLFLFLCAPILVDKSFYDAFNGIVWVASCNLSNWFVCHSLTTFDWNIG